MYSFLKNTKDLPFLLIKEEVRDLTKPKLDKIKLEIIKAYSSGITILKALAPAKLYNSDFFLDFGYDHSQGGGVVPENTNISFLPYFP
jgi:hypothetical protein